MPILVKDYIWKETEQELNITVPLKGIKTNKADIFSTDRYIKVNYPPFLFEVYLYAPVVEERCTAKVGNGVVNFVLVKQEPGVWGQLQSNEAEDKSSMLEKRTEAIEHAHSVAVKVGKEKAKKKQEEERYAVKQQMKLEEEERERIAREKQQERDRTERELEKWREERKMAKSTVKVETKTDTSPPLVTGSEQTSVKHIWKEKEKSKKRPPPRKSGSIQVHFTPRVFPTAARESKEQEEQEWLAKMAAARRIKTPESGEDVNEMNPEFLKDKGIGFFKAGNFEAAVNAFTEALKLNPHLPQLFSNRAACFLATQQNDRCISDCTRALELFYPVVPTNYLSRAKVFVRRGTAYANEGELGLAMQDYNAALKLSPGDEQLKEDYAKLKLAYENS